MSIYRRPGSDKWWISISIAGQKTRRTTGTEDRREAEEFEQCERERLWRLHKLGDSGAVRFQDAAQRWLDETNKRTHEKDEMILAWFCEEIGAEPLSVIDRDAIDELRKTCKEQHHDDGTVEHRAEGTVDRYFACLRTVLRKCEYEWKLQGYHAPKVPMFGKRRKKKHTPRFLPADQFNKLLEELPPHLKLAAQFAVLTGLRMRAMLQLTWDRVDLRAGRMWIPGDQQKNAEPHGLPIAPKVAKLLRQLKTLNPEGNAVFQWKGKPVDDCNGHAFKKAVARSGIGDLRWHDLRHTFASWALQNGVTLPELKELGAWKSFDQVLEYAHLAPDHLALAAAKIGTNRAQRKNARRSSG